MSAAFVLFSSPKNMPRALWDMCRHQALLRRIRESLPSAWRKPRRLHPSQGFRKAHADKPLLQDVRLRKIRERAILSGFIPKSFAK